MTAGDDGATARICVVGAGPRGISVVERLCANAAAAGPGRRVVVEVVDPHVHEGGRVWRVGQPDLLLMNTIASQVTLFTDDSVGCAGPVVPGPSLHEWARFLLSMADFDDYPASVRREAAALGPDSYPSRAFYGHYLVWVLRRLVVTAPPGVTVRLHDAVAVSVADAADGTQVVTLADGQVLAGLTSVVLAQGHVDMPIGEQERRFADLAAEHGLRYLPPSNPADADLSRIAPGERVGLRGMGLNFFDYMALLTSGRGGTFSRGPRGLVYTPSGAEPVLIAGSRRGVPYHARGENEKGVSGRHEPLFVTPEVIADLRARRAGFTAEVWPLVSKEVTVSYYRALLALRGQDFSAFQRAFVAGADESSLLDEYGIEPAARWDWDLVAKPYAGLEFADPARFREWLLEHLRADVVAARRGNVTDPLKAALDVLRDLRNEIRLVVDHSGIPGESYRTELQRWYTPLNAYLSIGPPTSRIEEMIALVEAGVLRVLGPGMAVEPRPDGFLLRADGVPGSAEVVDTLIEARLPEVDIRHTDDTLITHLRTTGGCAPYRIDTYETGGLAVTRRPYRVLDATGTAHPHRYAFGIPTEAVHWVTAAGIRPGVDSVILGDADAIARACLTPRLYTTSHIPLAWLPTSAPTPIYAPAGS
ncbi:FAD/NAD(P)-binding protein [Actinokineospora terrae]|uniref:FAD-NAD(P)-binding n=1 Tax=Actinokineospora terrae TaxID=155974 RepID=A0A1H9LGS1_9PSEU|nr:FAD/NAD(P)-binding protein [Actinokineospora terrae]SER10315.1 FAD-NAD(P)-binding [Actinokineospora terrae]